MRMQFSFQYRPSFYWSFIFPKIKQLSYSLTVSNNQQLLSNNFNTLLLTGPES